MNDPDVQGKQGPLLQHVSGVAATDVGMCREENQDSFGIIEGDNFRFFIVADGMGGVSGGAVASEMAITTIREYLADKDTVGGDDICKGVELVNQRIFAKGIQDPTLAGMGTTLVGCCFSGDDLYIVNVGDSRAYWIHGGDIRQLTDDHTLVMELLRSGAISQEQAQQSPVSHMLTRSLGPSTEVCVDCFSFTGAVAAGDRFLLCSDGLYNLVDKQEMADRIRGLDSEEAVQALVRLANARGGTDNVTVLIIEIGSGGGVYQREPGEHQVRLEHSERPTVRIERSDLDREVNTARREEQLDRDGKVISAHLSLGALREAHAVKLGSDGMPEITAAAAPAVGVATKKDQQRLFPAGFVAALFGSFMGAGLVTFLILRSVFDSAGPKDLNPQGVAAAEGDHVLEVHLQATARTVVSKENMYIPRVHLADALPPFPERLFVQDGRFGAETARIGLQEGDEGSGLAVEDHVHIAQRAHSVRAAIERTEGYLEGIQQSMQPAISEEALAVEQRIKRAQLKFDRARDEVESSVKRLAEWRRRKDRLSPETVLEVAGEAAVDLDTVKQHKDNFEKVTFRYAKLVEALQADSDSSELEDRMKEALEARNAALQGLIEISELEINRQIQMAEFDLESSSRRRDSADEELGSAEAEQGVIKRILEGDSRQHEELRVELEDRLQLLRQELAELLALQGEQVGE